MEDKVQVSPRVDLGPRRPEPRYFPCDANTEVREDQNSRKKATETGTSVRLFAASTLELKGRLASPAAASATRRGVVITPTLRLPLKVPVKAKLILVLFFQNLSSHNGR